MGAKMMSYTIRYAGGEISCPDARATAKNVRYLERDGHKFSMYKDGKEITREQLEMLALQQFSRETWDNSAI
jgi:hypothetical protein